MKVHKIQELSALGMLAFGCALTAAGFCANPVGQVHDSVLWVLGQCLVYAGSILGGKLYIDGIIHHKLDKHGK